MGVHKPEKIIVFGQNGLKVLSDMLAATPFFFGDKPTTLDVVSFASLAEIHFVDKEFDFPCRLAYSESQQSSLRALYNSVASSK